MNLALTIWEDGSKKLWSEADAKYAENDGDWLETINHAKLFDLAEHTYRAYGEVTDFKSFRGEPMPEFTDLPEIIKRAWVNVVVYLKF